MASARLRGKKFMALYRDAEGRQKSAGTYETKKAALSAATLAEAGMVPVKAQSVYSDRKRGKLTVAGYAPGWLANHPMAPHTAYVYDQMLRCHILPALGGRVLADVTAADIRAMFRALEAKGTSQALGKKIKTVMSAMFQVAAEDGLIPFNPARGVTFKAAPPKRRRALTADEWFRVRRYLTGQYRLLADVQMGTGARIEEIMALEAEDVTNGEWHVCRVRNQVNGVFSTKDYTKTGRDRWIPIEPKLAEQIKAAGPGRVFTDFLLNSYRLLHWYPACRMAGLDWRPAPRDLRRTFATLLRKGGADLETVRVGLGHTKLATTDSYLGERPETKADALEALRRGLSAA